jgi:3-oxoadipate enol-lactonase
MRREVMVENRGAQLYACAEGDGPPLVLVHGLGDDHRFWDPCVELLTPHHRVIRWDVRGFGRSSKPSGPYDLELFAGDLLHVLDELAVDRAHLVGLSMGGVIAQRFLLDHPSRLRSATLVSTSSEISEKATANWRRLADRVETRGFGRIDASRSFAPAFAAAHPEVVAAAGAQTAANDPAGYAAAARAVSAYNFTGALRHVRLPVLVVQGLDDQLTPPGGSVKMSRAIPFARLLMLPGAGHSLAVEQPLLFTAMLLAFTGAVEAMDALADSSTPPGRGSG